MTGNLGRLPAIIVYLGLRRGNFNLFIRCFSEQTVVEDGKRRWITKDDKRSVPKEEMKTRRKK